MQRAIKTSRSYICMYLLYAASISVGDVDVVRHWDY